MPANRFDALRARALSCAIVFALAACGGGGGGSNVRNTPPPPAPPAPADPGSGFTPTVANDSSLTQVTPPAIPAFAPPVTFASPSLSGHLILTNAAGALGAGLKGKGVTVGLVDTGVNRDHPALAGRVGRSFVHVDAGSNDTSVDDKVGHGTIVASLAAGKPATGNYLNSDGSNSGQTGQWGGGVAQDATIVSSRIIPDAPPVDDGSGEGNEIGAGQGYGDFFQAINAELADAGARVINNSWGGLYWNDPALTIELDNAWSDFVVARGGIVVFANGNAGEDPDLRSQPSDNARLPTLASNPQLEQGWLTVGALDPDDPTQLTAYSQECGSAMNYCLVAPGDVIFIDPAATSQQDSGLYQGGGTSFAAPQVAGAAAVVWSAFPYFDNDLVRQTILGAARDLGDFGVDPVFGWGLLDVSKAAKGPSQFAWGDVEVSFSGTSVWRNQITGDGGLIKSGPGTLILTEGSAYFGDTRVLQGGLYLKGGIGLTSDIFVSKGATVWSGGYARAIHNAGAYLASASGTVGARSFTQSATGNLGIWLGNAFLVTGPATLDGQISILGVVHGYTTGSQETLLNANSISGTFDSLKTAPNVFLDASLGYDPSNVFLDIKRIDVSAAAQSMNLSTASQSAAGLVESAFRALDAGAQVNTAPAFLHAAGALEHTANAADAERSLSSLSGELHASDAALVMMATDGGRQALEARLDEPRAGGAWASRFDAGRSLGDAARIDLQGWTLGQEFRTGSLTWGATFSHGRAEVLNAGRRDHGRDSQTGGQLYASSETASGAYLFGHAAFGRMQRDLQREIVLSDAGYGVDARYANRYLSLGMQAGRHLPVLGGTLTPYIGAQSLRLQRGAFREDGAAGFGLNAEASHLDVAQALLGTRYRHGWSIGSVRLDLDGHAEWQRTLSQQGAIEASFTGIDARAPLTFDMLGRDVGVLGAGLAAQWGASRLSLDLDARRGQGRSDLGAFANLQVAF